jgi:hypothetical protein
MAWSSVSCSEEAWTRREQFARDAGPQFGVTLRCAYSNRYALIADLLTTPRPWPDPPFSGVFAQNAVAVPAPDSQYVGSDQECFYEDALVTVNYGSRLSEDLISEVLEPTVEFLTLDHKRFTWGENGEPLLEAEAQGIQIRGHTLTRTMYNLAAVPISYLDLNGTCNDDDYTSVLLGLTYPEETLLFTPGAISRTIRTDGTDGFTAQVKFTYKKAGWNKYWRAKTRQHEEVWVITDDGTEPYDSYPPDDFSDWLF